MIRKGRDHQELLDAAREVLETLGGEEGYLGSVGKTKTDRLRNAVRACGGEIVYQRGTAFESKACSEHPTSGHEKKACSKCGACLYGNSRQDVKAAKAGYPFFNCLKCGQNNFWD